MLSKDHKMQLLKSVYLHLNELVRLEKHLLRKHLLHLMRNSILISLENLGKKRYLLRNNNLNQLVDALRISD